MAGITELRAALRGPGQGVLLTLLKDVYGAEEFDALLEATYRRGPSDTSDFLRNGLRLAMAQGMEDEQKHLSVAKALGQRPDVMKRAYDTLAEASVREVDDATALAQRKVIGHHLLARGARRGQDGEDAGRPDRGHASARCLVNFVAHSLGRRVVLETMRRLRVSVAQRRPRRCGVARPRAMASFSPNALALLGSSLSRRNGAAI